MRNNYYLVHVRKKELREEVRWAMKKTAIELKNKKKVNIIAYLSVVAVIVLLALFANKFYEDHFTIKGIKGEELLTSKTSPDGKYEVRAYLNNGGASADYAVLAVLIDKQNKTEKNIFWDSPCEEAKMQWISNDMLTINDISLHIPDETYDFRGKS